MTTYIKFDDEIGELRSFLYGYCIMKKINKQEATIRGNRNYVIEKGEKDEERGMESEWRIATRLLK